jgi:hypothetical protein
VAPIKTRRFGSVLAALSFAVTAVSGLTSFVSAYTLRLAGVHTVAGFVFVVAALVHVGHNARTLLRYLLAARRWLPSPTLVAALLVVVAAVVGALLPVMPVSSVLAWGRGLRDASAPKRTTYETIKLDVGGGGPALTLDLKAGPYFRFIEPSHGWEITPQIAVWLEDEDGRYLETLYVTHDEAGDAYDDGDGTSSPRPAALPVWRHRVSERAARHAPMPDVVTSATPTDNTYLETRLHTPRRHLAVLLELNSSFDYNDYYSRDRFPDDAGYTDGGNPAQPSIVYRADIDAQSGPRFTVMAPIGHGHPGGADGQIDPDLSHLTTALRILDRVVVEVGEVTDNPARRP